MALYLGIDNNGTFVSSDGYTLQDSSGLSVSALSSVSKYKIILDNIVYRVNVNLNTKEDK